jgi:NitT/TauT family transport system substrate-binding protein
VRRRATGYVVGMLLLLACSAPEAPEPKAPATPTAPAPRTVRLALNWVPEPEFGGFYAAALSGHYTKAGLSVEIIPGGPGAPVLEALQDGRANMVLT